MFKVGHSHDIHKLVQNRDLILGGVKIDYHLGLEGHSDADVLLHAIIECLIGAMGKGDIGKLFPDTDEKYKGISSMKLLEQIRILIHSEDYIINNIDSIIYAQSPNMQKHIPSMVDNIAEVLQINKACINVKATTYEKLGPIGNGQAIAAESICLINKK